MVQCRKCKAENPAEASTCQACGASLFEGTAFGAERTWKVIGFAIAFFLLFVPGFGLCLLIGLLAKWERSVMMIFLGVGSAVWAAILLGVIYKAYRDQNAKSLQPYNRFVQRGMRTIKSNPDQALADLEHGMALYPPMTLKNYNAKAGEYNGIVKMLRNAGQVKPADKWLEKCIREMHTTLSTGDDHSPEWAFLVKMRNELCQKNGRMDLLDAGRENERACDRCGRRCEGRVYTFTYGKKSTKITPLIVPGIALGAETTTYYEPAGKEEVYICSSCNPGFHPRHGISQAVALRERKLRARGYEAFLSPEQAKDLKKYR